MMLEDLATLDKWCTPLMLLLAANFMILTILFASRSGNDNGKKIKKKLLLSRSPSSILRRFKHMSHLATFNNNTSLCNNATQQVLHHLSDDGSVDINQEKIQSAEGAVNERVLSTSRSTFRNFREAELAAFKQLPIIETEVCEMLAYSGLGEETWTERSMDEVYSELQSQGSSHMNRTKSDTEPASGAVPVKLAKKMKKSASSKSTFKHFKEAEIVEARRPAATMKEVKITEYENEEDEDEDEEVDSKADDFINMFKQQLKLQRLDSILSYKEMLDRGSSR